MGKTTPKIARSYSRMSTPSNAWFLGPTNGITISSAIWAQLTSMPNTQNTDTQTDRQLQQ